jgi:hypothetical protein
MPLQEYAELIGVTDIKELRKTVMRDLNILKLAKFTYRKNPIQKGNSLADTDFWDVYLIGDKGIKNSQILVQFRRSFANVLLAQPTILQMDTRYFKVLNQNPRAFMLIPKIQALLKTNIADIRLKWGNKYTISVRSLYEYCQYIPRYETVLSEDRHVDKRIISPFENALDFIVANNLIEGITWAFDSVDATASWEKFINAKVIIDCTHYHYPGEEEMIKKQQKRISTKNRKMLES